LDRKLAVVDVLALLKATTDDQLAFYSQLIQDSPRPGQTGQVLAPGDCVGLLADPEARSWAGGWISELGPAIARARKDDPVQLFGRSRNERIDAGQQHPLRQRMEGVARMFGIEALGLYVLPDGGVEWKIAWTDQPVLALGAGVGRLPLSAQDFILGQALYYIAMGWYHLAGAKPEDVARLIKLSGAGLGADEMPGDRDAAKLAKAIGKAVPRKRRKELAAAWEHTPPKAEVLLHGAILSADRAGLLSCRTIGRALEVLGQVDPELVGIKVDDPASIGHSLGSSVRARRLMAFAISDEYFTLRQKLRLGAGLV
jgi:hypothetical protein